MGFVNANREKSLLRFLYRLLSLTVIVLWMIAASVYVKHYSSFDFKSMAQKIRTSSVWLKASSFAGQASLQFRDSWWIQSKQVGRSIASAPSSEKEQHYILNVQGLLQRSKYESENLSLSVRFSSEEEKELFKGKVQDVSK